SLANAVRKPAQVVSGRRERWGWATKTARAVAKRSSCDGPEHPAMVRTTRTGGWSAQRGGAEGAYPAWWACFQTWDVGNGCKASRRERVTGVCFKSRFS